MGVTGVGMFRSSFTGISRMGIGKCQTGPPLQPGRGSPALSQVLVKASSVPVLRASVMVTSLTRWVPNMALTPECDGAEGCQKHHLHWWLYLGLLLLNSLGSAVGLSHHWLWLWSCPFMSSEKTITLVQFLDEQGSHRIGRREGGVDDSQTELLRG